MKQRHLLFFTFVFLSFASLFGQTDAILSSNKKDDIPSKKLETLDSLISYHKEKDIDKYITYSIEYIELAKSLNSIKNAAKKAINVQNALSSTKKKHQKAIQVLNSVLAEKYKLKDSFLVAHLYYKRGRSHYTLDLKKAISDYEKALELYPKDSILVIGDAHLFKGNANADLGNFIDATKDFESAYQAYKTKNDREYMLYARQGNINIYSMNGFNQKAIDLRNEIIADLKEDEKKLHSAILYYNQALDYKKIGSKSLVIASLLDAEDAITPNTNSFLKTGIQGAILEYYAENSSINTPKVQKLFASIKSQLEDKEGQENYSLIAIHSALATYYYYANQYKKALSHALKRIEITEQLGNQDELKNAYQLVSKVYTANKNYKKALEYKNKYETINDKIYSQNNAFTLAYYQTLYETEKKEKALIETTKNMALLEGENKSFKKLTFLAGILSIFLFSIILLYRSQTHLKQKKLQQEKFSQELIINQEQERIRISKDLHDGLGQQLLLIKNKIIQLGDSKTKKMVNDAIDEVRTISRDLHPFQLQELGLTKAIEHALVVIDENTPLFISSEVDTIDNLFTPEQEVNIYRIVQESLNNVIKHARAEASKVSVKKLSKLIIISVRDNGIGFDFNEKYEDVKSLGLKTLLERTKFLNGQMKVQSIKNKGTLLEFQIPIEK